MCDNSLSISCLGDIAPVEKASKAICDTRDSVKHILENCFSESDLIFGNLETPVSSVHQIREDKQYIFNISEKILNIFPNKLIFSIANNHILDYGESGLIETIQNLTKRGFRYTGAGSNLAAAGKPVIVACKGRKIGFLACADVRNQAATEKTPGVFPANPELLVPAIKGLTREADLIYVSIHMGMEYIPVPSPVMIKLAGVCRNAGANVVIYHHSHCVSGYTVENDGAVVWGAGNFIFPQMPDYPFQPWFDAAIWRFRHGDPTSDLLLEIDPCIIDESGFSRAADTESGRRVVERIEHLSRVINKGGNLTWERFKNICRVSYLSILIRNYRDIARRRGCKYMLGLIFSSIKVLFFSKT